uniref:Uncharacterized protein n=1 Tax=Rhizophora mucronata TaxID=61149 RepID=A0A2P2INV8_RHIMU
MRKESKYENGQIVCINNFS